MSKRKVVSASASLWFHLPMKAGIMVEWLSLQLGGADTFYGGQWQGKPVTHTRNAGFSVKLEAIHVAVRKLHAI